MACVALTSLMATIELEFLHPNHRVSLCLDDEKLLKSVFEKLSSMEAFVKEEYNNAVGSGAPVRRHLLNKIRDFALKAEDAIEIQLTNILQLQQKADEAELHLHRSLQEVANEAEELLKVINNEVEAANHHSLPLIGWSEAAASHPHNIIASSGGSLQCSPQFEEEKKDIIMLFDDDFFSLRRHLIVDELCLYRRVLTIFGAPGIGKTTLCKTLYTDRRVVSHFDIQAWITIPPRHNRNVQQLLRHLLQSMRPTLNEEIDMGSTSSQLKEQLHRHLKCKRYLIVLDDVPNTLLWDDIHQFFPDDSNGSRILLTTVFADVVEYIIKYWNITKIKCLPYLSDNESWKLFSHRFSLKQRMTTKFLEIAEHLVEECGGLPRSIVTVADRLSKCNYTLKEWKKIEKELLSLGILHRDRQHSSKLTNIYNRLPQHLKVCFLYFVVFPKHSQINVKRLIKLWIAEGFVKPLGCQSLEDIGYKYLWALRRRGLVRIEAEYGSRPKTCSIHIDMHSFCVREAKKEGLLCAANTQQCIGWSVDILANSCRWLSLRSHSLDYHALFSSNIPRSLFVFQGGFERFIPFRHLRILDFSKFLILKRVSLLPLRNLVFLRYISIPQWFESFDDVVSSNSNLQTLTTVSGIDESTLGARTLHLSSKIWELQHLRHLKLGDMYMIDPPNMVKENLQTLVCAMPIHFRKKEVYYCRFPSIRKLEVVYKDVLVPGCNGERCCRNPIIILENFEDLLRLETLMVMVPVGSITLLEQVGFPVNLMKLRLSETNFPVKVLTVIGQLPKLNVLKLENAFYGKVWEVAEGGFPELEELEVESKSLDRWEANTSNHFPKLKKIFLKRCYSLEEIPLVGVIKHLLLSITLEKCPPSIATSAMRYQEEMRWYHGIWESCVIVDGKEFFFKKIGVPCSHENQYWRYY
ncbi:PREDICTED: putative late blight resistance protein homolog R1A-10 [Ipomoea nil]|uniref:putative late blight resistance protein homolog R1A-10 n=1 Tax=Ipomoea nil TaxID=35883 RepID=UPI000900D4F7|nr:PREDICTED: putative late blight resistance protein homolog R1A-10 [Ipomoea nil]